MIGAAKLLLLGIQIADAVAAGIPHALAAKRAIERMDAEDRDPTDAEWAEITAVTGTQMARLRAAVDAAGGAGA